MVLFGQNEPMYYVRRVPYLPYTTMQYYYTFASNGFSSEFFATGEMLVVLERLHWKFEAIFKVPKRRKKKFKY